MKSLTIKQRIRIMCDNTGITMKELAFRRGISASSFSSRLSTGKFTKKELIDIASAAGCLYVSSFVFDDGTVYNYDDMGEQIKKALIHSQMSATELGKEMGLTQQAISKRMIIGKFTQDDLVKIALHIGCRYVSEIYCPNGNIV